MISILAPSKTMDFSRTGSSEFSTIPEFIEQARYIVTHLSEQSVAELQSEMSISQALAENVYKKYEEWGTQTAPSAYAYRGDVYKGFYADTLSPIDLAWANKHIFIMSGLYGMVRLSDEISGYRLEMKQKIELGATHTLSEYWGERLKEFAQAQDSADMICVLSSKEYANPITRYTDSERLVVPIFMDTKPDGTRATIPIYSKMMRGVMARWIIDHRIDSPEGLKGFSGHGYKINVSLSTLLRPVFCREMMKPLQFDSSNMLQ